VQSRQAVLPFPLAEIFASSRTTSDDVRRLCFKPRS
jgi:hypothetical protein